MASKANTVTVIGDKTRAILRRSLATGWNPTTLAAEMQKRGHTSWNANVVNAATRDRIFTVDEAVSLLGVLKAHSKIITEEIDRAVAAIEKEARP